MNLNQSNLADGLVIIGTVEAVEPVKDRDGKAIDNLATVRVTSERARYRITIAPVLRTVAGEVLLPAWDKLRLGVNQRWMITVGAEVGPREGSRYVNFTAIDAQPIDDSER